MMVATFASTLLGFFREVVNARYFGTRWEMDTFLAAATIPTILFGVFNGALLSALVPVFSEYITHGQDEEAWRLGNTVLNILAIVLTVCAVVGWFLAPYYVPLIAHGFPAPQMGVAVHMTRDLMPSIVAVSLSGVLSAILNAYHRFRATAMLGIAINVVTIAGVVILNARYGIFGLVYGTLWGLIAQLFVQLPSFVKLGRYRPVIDLHHPGLSKIWTLLGPIMIGGAAGQLSLFFDRFFASQLQPGYMAGINYATKLVNFPQQMFAAAIATVIFPLLAAQFARDNRRGVASSAVTGLRLVNFITIPSVCALIVLAHPMIETLFQRGTFGPSATDLTASLLPYASIGLVALAANVVLTRCCFACKETAIPVAISVITVVINVLLSMLWLPTLGGRGLLLANSVSQSLQAALLLLLVARLVRGIAWSELAISVGKIVVASLAMFAALEWIAALHVHLQPTFQARAFYLFGQIALGGAAFLAAAKVVGVEELGLAWNGVVAKFERHVIAPPENRDAPIA
ncbi:MAG TPA: murein biosynthesis integral membrane protein MurJ [Candidatus Aquilonibacter sp.]|nr:murein biosynthesis integral membrane protein MurJ [Candidatus Aquilonibacter sp.]